MNALKRLGAALLIAGAAAGCATTGENPRDPLEPINRAIFGFNEGVDKAVLKPVAEGYRAVLPGIVRAGVTNFFANLEDVWIGINNLLQGKVEQGLGDVMRVAINSTFGLLGLIDVATDAGLEKHNEDFGQTLGRWGFGSGPYLVLPFFGPSSLRDGIGGMFDVQADLVVNIDHVRTRNTTFAVRTADRRANLLDASQVLEEAALDKYTFTRESYLQRRRSQIYDGSPPREEESGAARPQDGLRPARAQGHDSPWAPEARGEALPHALIQSALSPVLSASGAPVSVGSTASALTTSHPEGNR
ncbi:MAG: VacJ family lipoprotein [Betaproteobacteria bacterium]|nr:VacJ family lipoprotein [Betaproteobacteria bacterium]